MVGASVFVGDMANVPLAADDLSIRPEICIDAVGAIISRDQFLEMLIDRLALGRRHDEAGVLAECLFTRITKDPLGCSIPFNDAVIAIPFNDRNRALLDQGPEALFAFMQL